MGENKNKNKVWKVKSENIWHKILMHEALIGNNVEVDKF